MQRSVQVPVSPSYPHRLTLTGSISPRHAWSPQLAAAQAKSRAQARVQLTLTEETWAPSHTKGKTAQNETVTEALATGQKKGSLHGDSNVGSSSSAATATITTTVIDLSGDSEVSPTSQTHKEAGMYSLACVPKTQLIQVQNLGPSNQNMMKKLTPSQSAFKQLCGIDPQSFSQKFEDREYFEFMDLRKSRG